MASTATKDAETAPGDLSILFSTSPPNVHLSTALSVTTIAPSTNFAPPGRNTVTASERTPLTEPLVGWIYDLHKEDLKREMMKYSLPTFGNTDFLRKQFSKFWQRSAASLQKPSGLPTAPTGRPESLPVRSIDGPNVINLGTVVNTDRVSQSVRELSDELVSVREILGLSPNADSNTVRRELALLVRNVGDSFPVRNEDFRFEPNFSRPVENTQVTFTCLPNQICTPYVAPPIQNAVMTGDLPSSNLPTRHTAPSSWNFTSTGALPSDRRLDDSHANDAISTCNTVRKWNLKFDGRKDPVSFIERLEELMDAYSMNNSLILKALPELFYGPALLWYRNNKDAWRGYADFRRLFDLYFFPAGYYQNLQEEIRKRTQGEHENFRDFVVAISTLVRRSGTFSEHNQLELIYGNMRPEYKLMVRRSDFRTLEELISRAEDYETYLRDKNSFRPPPPPAMALLPETAYTPKSRADRRFYSSSALETPPPEITSDSVTYSKVFSGSQGSPNKSRPNRLSSSSPKKSVSFSQENAGFGASLNQSRPGYSPVDRTTNFTIRPRPLICWNCDGEGHLFKECRIPRVLRCYHCKTEGIATMHCNCESGNEHRIRMVRGHSSPQRNGVAQPLLNGINGSRK